MPSISTVQVDPVEIGRLAADLVNKLHDAEVNTAKIEKRSTVGVTLNMRDSTRRIG